MNLVKGEPAANSAPPPENEPRKRAFLSTGVGVITAASGLVGAVATLVAVLVQIGALGGSKEEPPASAALERRAMPSVTFSRAITLAASSDVEGIEAASSRIFERLSRRRVLRVPFPSQYEVKTPGARGLRLAYVWLVVEVTGGSDCILVEALETKANFGRAPELAVGIVDKQVKRSWGRPAGATHLCRGQGLLLPVFSLWTNSRSVGSAKEFIDDTSLIQRCVLEYTTKVSERSLSVSCRSAFPSHTSVHFPPSTGRESPGVRTPP